MNILWRSEALVAAMNGRPVGNLPEGVTGISIDTRTLKPGEAFFAIKGEKLDGHDFATAAIKVARDIVELLETHDLQLAAAVERDDDVLDALHTETFKITLADSWRGSVAQTVDVTLLARFFERFGDHAVSVARRITYLVTGDLNTGNGNADG